MSIDDLIKQIAEHRFSTMRQEATPTSVAIEWVLNTGAEELRPILEQFSEQIAQKAYLKGYNDNARDCYCDSKAATENILPHKHLMTDGLSHDIKPDLIYQKVI